MMIFCPGWGWLGCWAGGMVCWRPAGVTSTMSSSSRTSAARAAYRLAAVDEALTLFSSCSSTGGRLMSPFTYTFFTAGCSLASPPSCGRGLFKPTTCWSAPFCLTGGKLVVVVVVPFALPALFILLRASSSVLTLLITPLLLFTLVMILFTLGVLFTLLIIPLVLFTLAAGLVLD
uniref:Uncharacterized protein n=1 Tax=Cacopsylla melanoneura TaxID=428564 RepID=A0A8D8YMM7_9HEMI